VILLWLRRDLRLEDHRPLAHALGLGAVRPIFIFDPALLNPLGDSSDRRLQAIHQLLRRLDEQLARRGSGLWTFHGRPAEVLGRLVHTHEVSAVVCAEDYEPAARMRDAGVAQVLARRGIPLVSLTDQVVVPPAALLSGSGRPYTVFTPYRRAWLAGLLQQDLHPCLPAYERLLPRDEACGVIPLDQLGFRASSWQLPAFRLENMDAYERDRDFPARNGTTGLGLFLRFGALSVRRLAAEALGRSAKFLDALVWREFFMQILYHFPHVVDTAFREPFRRLAYRQDEGDFQAWQEGRTGFPLVDAGMRELQAEGTMPNRVRMVAASFLCKHLLLDWRLGEQHFARLLLDFDLAANNGNWQWVAGVGCDAAPYFRIFHPERQRERFDPQGEYIRRWVGEWDSSRYPAPMVDHALARRRALEVYGRCRQEGL
jgi:deoxyribodipyrimidine photo-lyase